MTEVLEDPEKQLEGQDGNPETADSGSASESDSLEKAQTIEGVKMSKPYELVLILTICLAQILSLAGLGQVLSSMYIIGDSFGTTDLAKLSWYSAGYSLTLGTFILPAGMAGDIYGHKRILLIGVFWYAVWSLVCGFSVYRHGNQGSILFSTARGFQGIGPALFVPNALAVAGRNFKGLKKNIVFALFGACAPIGAVLGILFAAIFAQLTWWPWAFWSMGIILFAYAGMGFLVIPRDNLLFVDHGRKPKFDYLGTATGVSGLVLFQFAWSQSGVVGWTVPYTYILLIVGVLFFSAFLYIETYVAKFPLVPVKGLTREACCALLMIACGWASFGIWTFYQWQLWLVIRQLSPLAATAQQSPVVITGLLAALSVGFFLHKVGAPTLMLVAMCAFLTGLILLATVPAHQTYWAQTFVSNLVTPFGMDISFACGTILLSNGMPREHQGTAASLINTVVNYSIAISLGVTGTIIEYTADGTSTIQLYRFAWYFGIGIAGLGVLIALYVMWTSWKNKKISMGQQD